MGCLATPLYIVRRYHCVFCHLAELSVFEIAYILFRLYRIWDDRKVIKYLLGLAFLICMIVTIVSDGYVLKDLISACLIPNHISKGSYEHSAEVQYLVLDPEYRISTCLYPSKPWYLVGSWGAMVSSLLHLLGDERHIQYTGCI